MSMTTRISMTTTPVTPATRITQIALMTLIANNANGTKHATITNNTYTHTTYVKDAHTTNDTIVAIKPIVTLTPLVALLTLVTLIMLVTLITLTPLIAVIPPPNAADIHSNDDSHTTNINNVNTNTTHNTDAHLMPYR